MMMMAAKTKPNILFIMADQMAAPMLPFYGPSPIKLPHLSRLATQGVVFDAAYCIASALVFLREANPGERSVEGAFKPSALLRFRARRIE